MEQRELLYSVHRNVNWCSHYGEQYRCSIKAKNKKTKDRAIMYLAIPLLGIYPEKRKHDLKG